jgi:hypothetical protein
VAGRLQLIDKAAADYNFASSTFRANPILLEGQNTATALRTNSYGSLISGVGDAASMGTRFNWGGGGGGGTKGGTAA